MKRLFSVCKCCRNLWLPAIYRRVPRHDLYRCLELDNETTALTKAQFTRRNAYGCPQSACHQAGVSLSMRCKSICGRCDDYRSAEYNPMKKEHVTYCLKERGEQAVLSSKFFQYAPPEDCPFFFEHTIMGQEQ